MPWDPKPPPPAVTLPTPSMPSAANGLPPSNYAYDSPQNGGSRMKNESGAEYLPNGYQDPATQGGLARAQQLVQAYHGGQGANAMQHGGLALPGQRSQGLQLPGQTQQQRQQQQQPPAQQHYPPHQRQTTLQQQHQQALQQQQAQPRIKVESGSPKLDQGSYQQQQRQMNPAYSQTDGAGDDLDEWQAMLAQRRAAHAMMGKQVDRMMRYQVMQTSSELQSGLMVPLDEQPKRMVNKKRRLPARPQIDHGGSGQSVPQLDGDEDDEDETKPEIKDEDDENAINSDLDDSDDEGLANIGDDDEENGDTILCTYDKVQRVKNKWKCTLKDGVMSVGGKEWVFHKGMGEFEW